MAGRGAGAGLRPGGAGYSIVGGLVLFRGRGRLFSAGGDLKARGQTIEAGGQPQRFGGAEAGGRPGWRRGMARDAANFVVAAVEGGALGWRWDSRAAVSFSAAPGRGILPATEVDDGRPCRATDQSRFSSSGRGRHRQGPGEPPLTGARDRYRGRRSGSASCHEVFGRPEAPTIQAVAHAPGPRSARIDFRPAAIHSRLKQLWSTAARGEWPTNAEGAAAATLRRFMPPRPGSTNSVLTPVSGGWRDGAM